LKLRIFVQADFGKAVQLTLKQSDNQTGLRELTVGRKKGYGEGGIKKKEKKDGGKQQEGGELIKGDFCQRSRARKICVRGK
jgi:hypothetical protein